MLSKYKYSESYIIPFYDVNEDISSKIISLIKQDYVLTVEEINKTKYYNIRKLRRNGYSVLSSLWEDKVRQYFKECGCRYFNEVKLSKYFEDDSIQYSLDYVLNKASMLGRYKMYFLGVKARGNTLFFVEADLI